MNKIKLNKFKQEIAAVYDRRQNTYDKGKAGNWHCDLACRLVEYVDLRSQQKTNSLKPTIRNYPTTRRR